MGMHVHPAWRHQAAIGLHFPAAGAGLAAHLGQAVAVDGDVAGEGGGAGTIDNGAAADDQIMHGFWTPSGL